MQSFSRIRGKAEERPMSSYLGKSDMKQFCRTSVAVWVDWDNFPYQQGNWHMPRNFGLSHVLFVLYVEIRGMFPVWCMIVF